MRFGLLLFLLVSSPLLMAQPLSTPAAAETIDVSDKQDVRKTLKALEGSYQARKSAESKIRRTLGAADSEKRRWTVYQALLSETPTTKEAERFLQSLLQQESLDLSTSLPRLWNLVANSKDLHKTIGVADAFRKSFLKKANEIGVLNDKKYRFTSRLRANARHTEEQEKILRDNEDEIAHSHDKLIALQKEIVEASGYEWVAGYSPFEHLQHYPPFPPGYRNHLRTESPIFYVLIKDKNNNYWYVICQDRGPFFAVLPMVSDNGIDNEKPLLLPIKDWLSPLQQAVLNARENRIMPDTNFELKYVLESSNYQYGLEFYSTGDIRSSEYRPTILSRRLLNAFPFRGAEIVELENWGKWVRGMRWVDFIIWPDTEKDKPGYLPRVKLVVWSEPSS